MTQPPPHPQPPYPAPGPYHQPYQAQPQGYQQGHPKGHPPQYAQQPYPPQPYAPAPQGQVQQPYAAPQAYHAHPSAYQQPPAYPQPPGQAYPGRQQAAGYDPNLRCRACGSGPAVRVTFRGVVGAVIMHTIWTATGPFCRDCGLQAFQKQTSRTLTGGWFSVGALILTPIFLLLNVIGRGKVAALPAPQRTGQGPGAPGQAPPVFDRPPA